MNTVITRDIITDLLPVYLSGEASADTKTLVESYMKSDLEFSRLVKSESRVVFTGPALPARPDQELRALHRARRRLRRKTWHLALAIFFTLTTFAFSIEPTGVTWTWEISPFLTLGLGIVAALFWGAYFHTSRANRSLGV